jgi:cell division septum initiation protein DivIVA
VLLYAWIAVAIATAGVLAAVILLPRIALLGAYGGGGRPGSGRFRFRGEKGESEMGSERRKLWARRESDPRRRPVQKPDEEQVPRLEEPMSEARLAKISAYGLNPVHEEAAEETPPVESANAGEVGVAVSKVLKSAEEAAARMRRAAHADAAKIRDEAKAAVDAEIAEARRVRGDAEADADSTRAAASTFAQKLRSDAENEAQELLQEARTRLERADSEIELKLRQAEQASRHRRQALEAEADRYHERLERMLGVVQAMSSQLEELLAPPKAGAADAAGRETLEDALQPGVRQPAEVVSPRDGSPAGPVRDLRGE